MSPWTILGWLLIGMIVIPIVLAFGGLAVALVQDGCRDYRARRAHKGKVRCQKNGCRDKATRNTQSGFYCERHWYDASRFGAVQYAHRLKYVQEDK